MVRDLRGREAHGTSAPVRDWDSREDALLEKPYGMTECGVQRADFLHEKIE